jgi:hypothetical protein|nr:hypothetical protein [Kofleriaceae bacterium]
MVHVVRAFVVAAVLALPVVVWVMRQPRAGQRTVAPPIAAVARNIPPPLARLTFDDAARASAFVADQTRREVRCSDVRPLLDGGERGSGADADACSMVGYGDIDGDGVADCWDATTAGGGQRRAWLHVWVGCTAGGVHDLAIDPRRGEVLELGDVLGTGVWPRWIATQIVGARRVSCAGDGAALSGCAPPDAAWRWSMAVTRDRNARAIAGAPSELAWQTDAEPPAYTPARALVDEESPGRWLGATSYAKPTATIVVVPADRAPTALTCGGADVVTSTGGVRVRESVTARWAWVFRALPGFATWRPSARCVDDKLISAVLESGPSAPDAMTIVDPRSGAWAVVAASAAITDFGGGDVRWNGVVPMHVIDAWLARGETVAWFDRANRPRVARDRYEPVALRGADADPRTLDLAEIGEATVPAPSRLTPLGDCAGWALSWSSTGVLVEQGHRVWLERIADESGSHITSASCDARGVVTIERVDGTDLVLGGGEGGPTRWRATVDLRRGEARQVELVAPQS